MIVAVPPKGALATVAELEWQRGQLLVCVAIDVEHAQLEAAAPGAVVVRAMPTAASAIGLGSTPVFPGNDEALSLFRLVGDVFACDDEDRFKVATALSTYHLWLFALMEKMADAAQRAGLPCDTAVGMVAGLTRSAGAFASTANLASSMRRPLDENGTVGTMTAQGFAVIEAADALAPWAMR